MAGVQGLWIGRLADVDMTLRSEAVRSGKKKPQLISVGALVLVGRRQLKSISNHLFFWIIEFKYWFVPTFVPSMVFLSPVLIQSQILCEGNEYLFRRQYLLAFILLQRPEQAM